MSLCRRAAGDIGEVARLRVEGVDRQPCSGFIQLRVEEPADWETHSYAQLNPKLSTNIEPLRLRHLPYPRYRAAEEDISTCLPHFHGKHAIRTARRGGHCVFA